MTVKCAAVELIRNGKLVMETICTFLQPDLVTKAVQLLKENYRYKAINNLNDDDAVDYGNDYGLLDVIEKYIAINGTTQKSLDESK